MKNLKLFGPRVLLAKEKPAQKGKLLLPDNRDAIHALARVVAIGDGVIRLPDGTRVDVPLKVAVGDIVFFQTNASMAAACSYELDRVSYMNLMQGDLLARLPDTDITVEKMEMLGDWVLITPSIRQTGTIILPATMNYQEHLEHTYWTCVKAAPGSDFEAVPGQEVLVNAHRASPVQIDSAIYCYIDRNFILGVMDVAPKPVSVLTA